LGLQKPKSMNAQTSLFSLDPTITYLNGAYMSPQLKSVEAVGIDALKRKSQPHSVKPEDFFTDVQRLKQHFGLLVEADANDCAIIPSVSYGMAIVAKNVPLGAGKNKIVVVGEQFPSNVYPWMELQAEGRAIVHIVSPPANRDAIQWNAAILDAIDAQTAMVSLGNVHWADGTRFQLDAIREKSRFHGAWMVIDGTQSVGALPFSVKKLQPEALICAGYKWLLGAYGLGMAYFSPALQHGKPLEENWINRYQSENFGGLVNYKDTYQPGAARFDMGEKSQFIHVPMLITAIAQLLEWGVQNIQSYCQQISEPAIATLREAAYAIHPPEYLAYHLWGVRFEDESKMLHIAEQLQKAQVFVSFRGLYMRVSPNVYNTQEELDRLVEVLVSR
jgi:selenocysteine lyase/cysteine desulfurase